MHVVVIIISYCGFKISSNKGLMSTQIIHISWLHIQRSFTLKKPPIKAQLRGLTHPIPPHFPLFPPTLSSHPPHTSFPHVFHQTPSLLASSAAPTSVSLPLSPIRLSVGGAYVTPHWTELYRCLSLSSLHHPRVSVAKSLWSSTPSVSLSPSDHVYRWCVPKWPPFISGCEWN